MERHVQFVNSYCMMGQIICASILELVDAITRKYLMVLFYGLMGKRNIVQMLEFCISWLGVKNLVTEV